MGINLLVFLDEILVFHADTEILAQQVQFMLNDGPLSGILWSQSKSVIILTRIIEHQGIILNTLANTFSLPERRYRKIVDLARSLLSAANRRGSLYDLQKFTGTAKSAHMAIGPRTNIFLRSLWDLMKGSPPANSFLFLTPQAILDLTFWLNMQPPSQPFCDPPPTCTIATDATTTR
jgi:hypothetical protein